MQCGDCVKEYQRCDWVKNSAGQGNGYCDRKRGRQLVEEGSVMENSVFVCEIFVGLAEDSDCSFWCGEVVDLGVYLIVGVFLITDER